MLFHYTKGSDWLNYGLNDYFITLGKYSTRSWWSLTLLIFSPLLMWSEIYYRDYKNPLRTKFWAIWTDSLNDKLFLPSCILGSLLHIRVAVRKEIFTNISVRYCCVAGFCRLYLATFLFSYETGRCLNILL